MKCCIFMRDWQTTSLFDIGGGCSISRPVMIELIADIGNQLEYCYSHFVSSVYFDSVIFDHNKFIHFGGVELSKSQREIREPCCDLISGFNYYK